MFIGYCILFVYVISFLGSMILAPREFINHKSKYISYREIKIKDWLCCFVWSLVPIINIILFGMALSYFLNREYNFNSFFDKTVIELINGKENK